MSRGGARIPGKIYPGFSFGGLRIVFELMEFLSFLATEVQDDYLEPLVEARLPGTANQHTRLGLDPFSCAGARAARVHFA